MVDRLRLDRRLGFIFLRERAELNRGLAAVGGQDLREDRLDGISDIRGDDVREALLLVLGDIFLGRGGAATVEVINRQVPLARPGAMIFGCPIDFFGNRFEQLFLGHTRGLLRLPLDLAGESRG